MGEMLDDHRRDGRGAAARVGLLSTEPRRVEGRATWTRARGWRWWNRLRGQGVGLSVLAGLGILCFVAYAAEPAPSIDGDVLRRAALPAAQNPAAAARARAASVVDPVLYCRLARFDVHDGDTIEDATILLPYDQTYWGRGIRVDGFDAWESDRTRQTIGEITTAELVKGARATAEARECLTQADAVYVQAGLRARFTYERLLAKVWFDPPGPDCTLVNFGDWMRARGHARPTDPVLEKEANARRKAAAKKVSEALFRAK
jgi:hypothetical protein